MGGQKPLVVALRLRWLNRGVETLREYLSKKRTNIKSSLPSPVLNSLFSCFAYFAPSRLNHLTIQPVIAPRDAAKVEDGSRPKTNPRQDFWGRTFLIHTLSTYNYYKNIYIVQQVLKEPHDP
ncbi:MAG: hypothetical protein EAZ98_15630 [Oscillatoriales cyanobacterium]|nr:MAG: hypothetical protein EAZ98_15630 [Oscillatoriales cyanobacterium]